MAYPYQFTLTRYVGFPSVWLVRARAHLTCYTASATTNHVDLEARVGRFSVACM